MTNPVHFLVQFSWFDRIYEISRHHERESNLMGQKRLVAIKNFSLTTFLEA